MNVIASVERNYRIRTNEFKNKKDTYFSKYNVEFSISRLIKILGQLFPIHRPTNSLNRLINELDEKTNLFKANESISENPINIIGEFLDREIIMNSYSKYFSTAIEWNVNKSPFTNSDRFGFISIQYNCNSYTIFIIIDFFKDHIYMRIKNDVYRRSKEIKNAMSDCYDVSDDHPREKHHPIINAMLYDERLFRRVKSIKNNSKIKTMDEYLDFAYNAFSDKFIVNAFDTCYYDKDCLKQ